MSLTVLFILLPILVAILLGLNILLAPHKPYTEKVTQYECGFSVIEGQTRAPFNVAYFLVGLLFLVFDLEIAVFYPFAVSLYHISLYGFWIATIFIIVLTLGFVYELSKGALDFTSSNTSTL